MDTIRNALVVSILDKLKKQIVRSSVTSLMIAIIETQAVGLGVVIIIAVRAVGKVHISIESRIREEIAEEGRDILLSIKKRRYRATVRESIILVRHPILRD